MYVCINVYIQEICVYVFNSNLNLEMDELIVAICNTTSIDEQNKQRFTKHESMRNTYVFEYVFIYSHTYVSTLLM